MIRVSYTVGMEWLQRLIDAAGTTQAKLAMHLKIAPSRVSEMVRGERRMQQHEIKRAAEFFGIRPDLLTAMIEGDRPAINGAIDLVRSRTVAMGPAAVKVAANDTGREPAGNYPETPVSFPSMAPGKPDVPLWASAAAGDEGAMILVPDPIGYISRSDRMLGVGKPFAFNVIGDSMSPAIEHGDQLVINPSVVARGGHDCVFINEGADGMFALVKRLVRPGPDNWQVRQFNPCLSGYHP